jgi:hypothetical protein
MAFWAQFHVPEARPVPEGQSRGFLIVIYLPLQKSVLRPRLVECLDACWSPGTHVDSCLQKPKTLRLAIEFCAISSDREQSVL